MKTAYFEVCKATHQLTLAVLKLDWTAAKGISLFSGFGLFQLYPHWISAIRLPPESIFSQHDKLCVGRNGSTSLFY